MLTIFKFCFGLVLFTSLVACHTPVNKKETKPRKATEMDGIERAMLQEFRMTQDPSINSIPRERLAIARTYMKNLVTDLGIGARTAALGWQERGPINVGGRTRAMLVDKNDATGNTVFAASVSGGLFKTINFTAATPTWTPVNDFLPNLAISSMVQDNVNPNIMYAGTGEGWFNIDGVKGAGIYKSTDGGLSWAVLPSTISTSPVFAPFQYVQDLAIDNNGNIYASLRNDINSATTSVARGVQRSTDGGTTWAQVLGASTTIPELSQFVTGRAADLEVASNGDVYASLGLVGAAVTNRSVVMKSSFATHGANTGALGNWVNITPVTNTATQRTEIILAPSDPQRVYLLMQDSASWQVLNVYKSIDGGANWTTLPAPGALNNGANSQTWFNLIGACDPTNADILTVGGLFLARSTNGGVSWTGVGNGSIHVDQHYLQYVGSSKLVVGNDGGVYYSTNIDGLNPTFSNKNNGFNVTQYYACDLHPTDANYFLAGAQDNGTQKFSSAGLNTTTNATGGDGGFCHIDQTNGQIQITATIGNTYFRSLNGGGTFTSLGSVNNERGQFINPTDFDDKSKVLYCGDDAGKYYYITGLGGTPSGNVNTISLMGSRELTAVKVDTSEDNTIYIGASFGGLTPQILKVSSANTSSPVLLSFASLGTTNNAAVSSIDIDPANSNHLVATLSNYGVVSVWESTNGGASFTNIEGNLPDMPVRWAIFAPANAQLDGPSGGNGGIILATELGIWTTSLTAGASTQWIPNNQGLANVRTDMIRYRGSDNTVVAATHGRGLFTSILPTVVTGVPNNPVTKDFIKYISADNSQLHIITGTLQTRSMTIQLLNMQGQRVYQSQQAYHPTTINLDRLQSGAYIIRITGDKRENFVQQFIKK